MPETDRDRLLEIRRLLDRGEYQIDPAAVAVHLVDEHLAAGAPASDPQTPIERGASASGNSE